VFEKARGLKDPVLYALGCYLDIARAAESLLHLGVYVGGHPPQELAEKSQRLVDLCKSRMAELAGTNDELHVIDANAIYFC
jgi:hypothetical protein